MRSAFSSIARPRTEIRSGSPGPAPTISMCPRRWAQMSRGGGYRIVLAFAFRHYQLAISGGQQCGCLAYTGRTHVLHHCFAGVGHVHCRQFLGRIEEDFVFLWSDFTTGSSRLTLIVDMVMMDCGEMLYSSSFSIMPFTTFLVGLACRASPMPTCTTRGT